LALAIHGISVTDVFGLKGTDENSATFALGWALERCGEFRRAILKAWPELEADDSATVINLQKHGEDGGYTGIEIHSVGRFHAIIEAKRSWDLPTQEQLLRYRSRLVTGSSGVQRMVSITAASASFAKHYLPTETDGASVIHQSWGDVRRIADAARIATTSREEKLWLNHLTEHLKDFVAMDRITDNSVDVVSLGLDAIVEGSDYTWVDVVEKDGRYFHPMGGAGWPVQPPNYMGFRYHGRLQSIHHVESHEVVQDLSALNPLWPKTDTFHFVYVLGPAMRPMSEIRTGNIFRAGRVTCAIDTLLSGAFETISDARDETKRRLDAGDFQSP